MPRRALRPGESKPARKESKSDRIEVLWKQGITDTRALMELVGASERHVQRVAVERNLRAKQVGPSLEKIERARALLEEGMIATWVAEDTGLHYTTVLAIGRTIPARNQMTREWKLIWQQIRKNDLLYALHTEIAGAGRREREILA